MKTNDKWVMYIVISSIVCSLAMHFFYFIPDLATLRTSPIVIFLTIIPIAQIAYVFGRVMQRDMEKNGGYQ